MAITMGNVKTEKRYHVWYPKHGTEAPDEYTEKDWKNIIHPSLKNHPRFYNGTTVKVITVKPKSPSWLNPIHERKYKFRNGKLRPYKKQKSR